MDSVMCVLTVLWSRSGDTVQYEASDHSESSRLSLLGSSFSSVNKPMSKSTLADKLASAGRRALDEAFTVGIVRVQ